MLQAASTGPESRSPRPAGVAVEAVDLHRRRDRRRFVEVPRRLHRRAAQYVSPLIRDRMWFLDPARNPSAAALQIQAFVAHQGGAEVGRVLAFIDPAQRGGDPRSSTGFIGCFDAPEDPDVALALLDRARRWLRSRGCVQLEGPVDLGLEHGGGVLVQGCERPPVVGTAWNPDWYDGLLRGAGLRPQRELLTWGWKLDEPEPGASLLSRAERVRTRLAVQVRVADTRRLESELAGWHALFNASQRDRSGCGSVPRPAFDALAYDLARIAVDDLIRFAEVDGRPVGVAVCVPDVNPLLSRSGRLLPLAWLRLHRRRWLVGRVRLRWLSIHPDFRMQGVETVLLAETAVAARRLGVRSIDVCWTGEGDHTVHHELRQVGARLERRHRIYRGSTAA